MNKTSENRRLTFYRHLTSYVLANEVDKFVSTRLGKADQADVQLLIANGEGKHNSRNSFIECYTIYISLDRSRIFKESKYVSKFIIRSSYFEIIDIKVGHFLKNEIIKT